MSESSGYDSRAFVAEYYDLVPAYAGRPDVDFYVVFSRAAEGKTLELGCGTGRVLIPTATAGCGIVGLDSSRTMLAKCREKLSAQPTDVQGRARLVEGDMTDFDLGEAFGLITVPFRAFQHLISVEDQLACLDCVRGHLAPGGKFILEVFHVNPNRIHGKPQEGESEDTPDTPLPDGRTLRRTSRAAAFRRSEQVNEVELIYYVTYPDGRTERLVHAFPFRYFHRFELEHLLARAGLRVAELFGDFDRSPFGNESPQMIFVAQRGRDAERGG